MNIEECFYLGYTSKVHAKQGEIVLKLDVDFPERYKKLESVLVRMHKQDQLLVPFFITHSQLTNDGNLRIKIDDINSVDQAKELIAKEVYLPLNQLPPLSGNQFYFHEVIGFEVEDAEKGNIGKIINVLDHPTQAILEIQHPSQKEILIPINDQNIVGVNREEKRIQVKAPEGLIDIYLD